MAQNIHDYIINKLTYATSAVKEEQSTGKTNYTIRSVYTAFTGTQVVCEGYAKAFKYLCDMYDIPCIMVVGVATNSSGSENHMWNLVMFDGEWYTVDPTWDDPVGGTERESYFLAGQKTVVDKMTVSSSHNTDLTTETYGFSLPAPMSAYAYYSTVTFNSFGGSSVESQTVRSGNTIVCPDEPTKKGFRFLGWFTNYTGGTEWDWDVPVNNDMTLYAQWVKKGNVTVTLDSNNSSGRIWQSTVTEGSDYTIPEVDISWDSHLFAEWNTEKDGTGTSYSTGDTMTADKDITLYAIWDYVYTISFDTHGGSPVSDITGTYGTGYVMPDAPVKDKSGFSGWNTAADGSGSSYAPGTDLTMTEDITYHAIWIALYDVSYYAGEGIEVPGTITVMNGMEITVTDLVPAAEGFVFSCWNTESDGSGASYKAGDRITVTKDITLYAVWKQLFTISFSANGGIGSMENVTVIEDDTFTVPASAYSMDGYGFGSWNTASDGSGKKYAAGESFTVKEDVTLHAIWLKICRLSYDSNGGYTNPEGKDVLSGESIAVTDTVPLRLGYVLKGWNTASDGSGTTYKAGEMIAITKDTTLYAVWETESEGKAEEKANDIIEQLKQGLADFGTETEKYFGAPWVPGIANVYIVIIGVLAALGIASLYLRRR